MSTIEVIILLVVLVVFLLLLGGIVATRRRADQTAGDYQEHLLEADEALELARAKDKGWDREALDRAARSALEQERPGWAYDELHLILVEDREGLHEDRAHLVAIAEDSRARVILTRHEDGWDAERVEPAR